MSSGRIVAKQRTSDETFQLFSDGGGERGSAAAAACILDLPSGTRIRLAVSLGGASNNEAEILGGVIGLTLLKQLSRNSANLIVNWYSDSEYTLKSASQYIKKWQVNGWKTADKKEVKNLGLWRTYLEISKELEVNPNHVRGHSGHPENEECDQICTKLQEMQRDGEDAFSETTLRARDGHIWNIADGREIIENLREDDPDVENFIEQIEEIISNLQSQKTDLKPATIKPDLIKADFERFSKKLDKLSNTDKTEVARLLWEAAVSLRESAIRESHPELSDAEVQQRILEAFKF